MQYKVMMSKAQFRLENEYRPTIINDKIGYDNEKV